MTAKSSQLKVLSRADILEANDRQTEWVDVPEWGGRVLVRSLEGLERDRYESALLVYGKDAKGLPTITGTNTDNVRAQLCAMTMIDEEGTNLFTAADVLVLGHKSAAALERVFQVAQRLSNLTDRDVERLMDGLGKDPSAASGSSSPAT